MKSYDIYGIGSYFDKKDITKIFISGKYVGTGWDYQTAPEIHSFIKSLKEGDIVYIKSFSSSSPDIIVKGIGIISDNKIVVNNIVQCGRNVIWKNTSKFRLPKPKEKNNVRRNTIYKEFHPDVQAEIIKRV